MKLIGDEAWEAIMAADLAKHGSWPVAGGWLEQTQWCLDAVRLVWNETAYWKAHLRIENHDG